MYKLFLCLRYLRSRVIAYFAILAVALCVAMMLIVISVMNGFLHKIEIAAKGLFGDIIVDAGGLSGMAYYDDFIVELRKLPEVDDASPFIYTGGILESKHFTNRQLVQISGVRLSQPKVDPVTKKVRYVGQTGSYASVSDFGKGLFSQAGSATPTFDPDLSQVLDRLYVAQWQTRQSALEVVKPLAKDDLQWSQYYIRPDGRWTNSANIPEDGKDKPPTLPSVFETRSKWRDAKDSKGRDALTPEQQRMLDRLVNADDAQEEAIFQLKDPMRWLQARIRMAKERPNNDAEVSLLEEQLSRPAKEVAFGLPADRAIIGASLFSFRTSSGQLIRQMPPGNEFTLTMIPLGQKGISAVSLMPQSATFTVVDDSRTDVSTIDSGMVYIPFETLQELNKMAAQPLAPEAGYKGPPKFTLARCSQIQIKVKNPAMSEQALQAVRQKISNLWVDFRDEARHEDLLAPPAQDSDVQTWRQRQFPLISQIASQRTLVVIMFGIISLVSVVLIFVIFYMIVFQKTKDIGVIKSLGASSYGVAGIFLGYGATVGLVGAILGTGVAALFVHNINPIADWIGDTFGLRPWNREWFMFDKIPNDWEWSMAGWIMVAAIAAGLIGALLPAIVAARKQPVEALRYE
jgi:ABC-type lipoprotein release transport system permease subunit